MLIPVNKIKKYILYCLVLLLCTEIPDFIAAERLHPLSTLVYTAESDDLKGYTDVVMFKGRFFAVGTDGRIDNISISGEKVPVDFSSQYKLNCAFSNEKILIVAGDHGTILYSYDGKCFYRAEPGTDKNILCVTCKNGLILAGAEEGTIFISLDGISWSDHQVRAKGNILSLSANDFFFIGITDAGEIIKSVDGINWGIKDYNKEYAGYNKYSKFKKILATQKSIVIIGTFDDGSPSILFSTLGNVWAERMPFYHDNEGKIWNLTSKPNGITFDPSRDQFILACDNGELFSLPNCTKCNEVVKISKENLNAIIFADNHLITVGDDFSVYIH